MAACLPSADRWDLAACRAAEPDLFFPISAAGPARHDVARARAVCHRCQIRAECLDYALATRQPHGIWGGLTEEERRPLLRLAAARLSPHRRGRPAGREHDGRPGNDGHRPSTTG